MIEPEELMNKCRMMSIEEGRELFYQFKNDYPASYSVLAMRIRDFQPKAKHRYYKINECEKP